MSWAGPLEKIDDYHFKIPKSYKNGMRVDGLIVADDKLIRDILKDKACEQVANVAFLPGIVGNSLAMPDAHWGYGFPIGGVAATDIEEGGVISPGGVGFDINCLTEEARILTEYGYSLPIKDFERCYDDRLLKCLGFHKREICNTGIKRYIKIAPARKVYKLKTLTGLELKATGDHPFWTEDGMVILERLKLKDKVAVYPFCGVPYVAPSDDIIIDEEKIKHVLKSLNKGKSGNADKQILNQLKKRDFLPLRYDSEQLPIILKLMGYLWGDGSVHFLNQTGKGVSWFWGKTGDLEAIQKDVFRIGFTCSRVYKRERDHKINTRYGESKFSNIETSCKVTSSSFAVLMQALGLPIGNKARQSFSIPGWIKKAPLWQKRLFLASFFGAEMSSPKSLTENSYNLYCPILSLNKAEHLAENGRRFLEDISSMLDDFGVRTHKISRRDVDYISKEGIISVRLRLILSGQAEDLINLYTKVGFEYNKARSFLANLAAQFLRYKKTIIRERSESSDMAVLLKEEGLSAEAIYNFPR